MRILVVRLGAFGDCLIVTPLLRHLKNLGNEVYMLTSEDQGRQMLEGNPNIDKIIYHKKDSIAADVLGEYFKATQTAYECDKLIDLCESIEARLCLLPIDPRYKYTKPELMEICNKNYYEETFRIAGYGKNADRGQFYLVDNDQKWMSFAYGLLPLQPEIFFTDEEHDFMAKQMQPHIGKFKILWGLSGSSRQKTYPTDHLLKLYGLLKEQYQDNFVVYTVGDELCQLLEIPFEGEKTFQPRSGVWTMRQSILAARYVDVVISPDTGLLHGAGCFDTPKIGLLTHTTIENITKHFKSDYSLEAKDVACAPCFHMTYNARVQVQLAEDHTTPMCMMYGIPPQEIFLKIQQIRKEFYELER